MKQIVRYIDARLALERPSPVMPRSDQDWSIKILAYFVILGLAVTGVLLAWVWG
jgi:hypothetical protein